MTEIIHLVSKTSEIAKPGEPDPEIVERLEQLLELAKAGELTAIAYTCCHVDQTFGTGWIGGHGTRDKLNLGITVLGHRYTEAVIYGDQE